MNLLKIFCWTSLLCLFSSTIHAQNSGDEYKVKTIVIDAGHGGKDPGSFGYRKTKEKDIALSVALKVGKYLEDSFDDVKVIYTRKTDVFLALHERATIANKAKADLFISIHANCHDNHSASGSETYVLGLHRSEANLAVAKKENSVIDLEEDREDHYDFDVNSPEGHIIMTMKQNAHLEQSIALASKIQHE